MKPYRLALVGCGDIAESAHVPQLMLHPRFKLVELCDVRADRAALLASRAGDAPFTTDYRTLLDRKDIDAVLLALPPQYSVEVAIDFLQHGKPVLDEKPLATSLREGRRLAKVVSSAAAVYQIGFAFRYAPFVREVGALALRVGTPAQYEVSIYDECLDRANAAHFQRIQASIRTSSAMTHEGSHPIDFFSFWNPAPLTRVCATAIRTHPEFDGPNLWSAQFRVADGSALRLDIGWFLPELPASTVRIIGPRGVLTLGLDGAGELQIGGKVATVRTQRLSQGWVEQLDTFASSIDHGRAETATVYDGLRALAATQACEQSAKAGQAVDIETVGPRQ